MFFSQRPPGANLWAVKLDLYWMQQGRSHSIRGHGVSCEVLEHIEQGVPKLWAWAGISCEIRANIRLQIKCTVNVMCLNHPETIPPSPGPWKNCLHVINSWCQKCWGPLTYRMWTLTGWFWGASMQDCFPDSSDGKESTCNMGDLGLIPGLGRSPGEGKGYPLQYSSLENSMDHVVHGVAKSWTRLSDFHFHTQDWLTLIGCC